RGKDFVVYPALEELDFGIAEVRLGSGALEAAHKITVVQTQVGGGNLHTHRSRLGASRRPIPADRKKPGAASGSRGVALPAPVGSQIGILYQVLRHRFFVTRKPQRKPVHRANMRNRLLGESRLFRAFRGEGAPF